MAYNTSVGVVRLLYNFNQTYNSSLDRDSFMGMATFFHLIDKMQQLSLFRCRAKLVKQCQFFTYMICFFVEKHFKNSNLVYSTRVWNNHQLVMNIAEILLIWHFTTNNRSASILSQTHLFLSWPINIFSYLVKEY